MDILKKFLKIQNDEEDKAKHKKIINYDNQEKYEGYTNKQGARHGGGTMHYNNGDKYEGDWYNNLRQGQGKQYYQNGDFYTGQWNKDRKEGIGQYFYSNNERYEGEWYNDYRHGYGSHYFRNGDFYVGQWSKGKKEGRGKMTYYNNEEYEGEWLNDKKHIKAQNNDQKEEQNYKRRKNGADKDDRSDTEINGDKNKDEQVRNKDSIHSQRKDSSPKDIKKGQDDKYDDDDNKPSSDNIKEENQINLYSNNQINSNMLESQQHQYTNQYHSNRDNDFQIATNVESIQEPKSNMIATEVIDTYRTNGQSLQISIDDNKAIDILDIMESYEILNNFPQDLREWDTGNICKWLESIGLGEYTQSFESNQICGQSICMLTEQELEQSIGMKALGKRKIFLKYQEMLKKYYNKKLSKDVKAFIQKHQSRFKKGEKSLQLKYNQNNYRSIREEDESASSHKNSLNSNQINQMENFMLLEEDEEEDRKDVKKQKDKDKKKDNSHRDSDEDKNDNNNKKQTKLKKKKRDQGSNPSSNDESDFTEKEGTKNNIQRDNSTSNLISSKEDLVGGKEKKYKKTSPSLQFLKRESDEKKQTQKDTMRHFADDEDEEIHKYLKFQKVKSQGDQKFMSSNMSKVNSDTTHNHHKAKLQGHPTLFSEDKYLAEQKIEKKSHSQYAHEKVSKNNSTQNLQQDDKQDAGSSSNNGGNLRQDSSQQLQNAEETQQTQKDAIKTQSLDNNSTKRHNKKADKINTKDCKYNSNESDDADHKLHKSDDAASSHYLNSPEIKHNDAIKSLQPDFMHSKPFILNFNSTFNSSNENTLYKLGIQKDLCISEKNDSTKTGLTKMSSGQSGVQTNFNQSSGGIGNPTTQNSSVDNNQGQNKGIQNSNIQQSSSTSSSDESSDSGPSKPHVNKRSKGDGGASISSLDSDNNSKIKQKQTPQQKFKNPVKDKDKDGSRNPSKDKSNNTPQIKPKDKEKKKEVSKEKSKLRVDREQQLEQLLRDMGINKKLIIAYSELDFGKKIGEGSYGQVFKGMWAKTQVAIKQFGKQNSKFHLRKVQDFISEVRVINNLRHPNIVLYMGVCLYQSQYFMITEYLQEGSLYDHLHIKHTNFSESKQIDMIEDMALGMVYLHGRKVMHCDLKSSNVLIDENWNVKLCDFGLSRIKSTLNKKKNERKAEGLVGTPQWMAPEIMRREQYQEHSDVYSFGMIMWEIATRKVPYLGLSHQQIYGTVGYDENYQVEVPKRGIPRYLNLMRKCLRRNPSERPTFQEVVEEILLIKRDLKDNNKKQVVKEIIRFFD